MFIFREQGLNIQTRFRQGLTGVRFQIYMVTQFYNHVQKYTDTKRLHESDFSVFGAVTS